MIAKRITVGGRVQGVGFRETLIGVARSAGVNGWVRNRREGTVEALVQGERDAVERVVSWCRHGPPVARVTSLHEADESVDPALEYFVRRPTA